VAFVEIVHVLADPGRPPMPADIADQLKLWAADADRFVDQRLHDQIIPYRLGLSTLDEPVVDHGRVRDFIEGRLSKLRTYAAEDRVTLREIMTSVRSTDAKTTRLIWLTIAIVVLTVAILVRDVLMK
jgi:hypothetical protein